MSAALAKHRKGGLELASDKVGDGVNGATGEREHASFKGVTVDNRFGTQTAQELMVSLRGRTDHVRPTSDRDLRGKAAHASSCGMNQQALPGEIAQRIERTQRCTPCKRKPCGLLPRELSGLARDRIGVDRDPLSKRAVLHDTLSCVGEHLVTDRKLGVSNPRPTTTPATSQPGITGKLESIIGSR